MGRTADIKTKAVATRVPMADYIKILQESSGRGISVSDYVSEKLSFQEIKLEKGGGLTNTITKEVDKKETLEKLKNLQSEASSCKSKVLSLEKEISVLKSEKTMSESVSNLLDELFTLNAKTFSVFNEKKNPYHDLVNKIQQELKK